MGAMDEYVAQVCREEKVLDLHDTETKTIVDSIIDSNPHLSTDEMEELILEQLELHRK